MVFLLPDGRTCRKEAFNMNLETWKINTRSVPYESESKRSNKMWGFTNASLNQNQ